MIRPGRDVTCSKGHGPKTALIVLVLCSANIVWAEGVGTSSGEKLPAWKWEVSKRLAQRFDEKAMQARSAEHAKAQREILRNFPALTLTSPEADSQAVKTKTAPRTDSIAGDKTPELFLSFELFSYLIDSTFSPDHPYNEARRRIETRAAALGFGADLWSRLEKASEPFLRMERQRQRLARTEPSTSGMAEKGEMNEQARLSCRARAEAIAAAKVEFGEEPFLRLLYEVVAPNIHVTYVVSEATADHLRFLEGGCR